METLIKIYNTLLTISTKGEDSFKIVECLYSLRKYIED